MKRAPWRESIRRILTEGYEGPQHDYVRVIEERWYGGRESGSGPATREGHEPEGKPQAAANPAARISQDCLCSLHRFDVIEHCERIHALEAEVERLKALLARYEKVAGPPGILEIAEELAGGRESGAPDPGDVTLHGESKPGAAANSADCLDPRHGHAFVCPSCKYIPGLVLCEEAVK